MGLFDWIKAAIRPKPQMPALSQAMTDTIATTVAVCSRQFEQCLGSGIAKLPYISDFHDDMAATYALGFLQGSLLSNHADITWAKGDRGLADVGWYACAGGVVTGIFDLSGQDDAAYNRVMSCSNRLPQFRGEQASGDWLKIEMGGGSDAMALAQGKPMPKGGYLRIILDANLTGDQKARIKARL
ncbi:hypothetical protein [Hyphomicrobium sp.]|uniref:hypothetical protein n=1 Tax=Hyphomicrobium sp. TaxID=82 RepID=UPI002FDFBAAF